MPFVEMYTNDLTLWCSLRKVIQTIIFFSNFYWKVTLLKAAQDGLAASENFGAVRLQNMEETKRKHEENVMNPYNALMLVMIKGRYHVQVRLVEPCVESMNDSDCFLLITRKELIVWKGWLLFESKWQEL